MQTSGSLKKYNGCPVEVFRQRGVDGQTVRESRGTRTLRQHIVAGNLSDDEALHAARIFEAQDTLLRSDIVDYKLSQAKIKAQRLFSNPDFQRTIEELRVSLRLTPCLPGEDVPFEDLHDPDAVLKRYIWSGDPSPEQWEWLQYYLWAKVYAPFGLDPLHDCGLLVVALCFDHKGEILGRDWEKVQWTAAKRLSPGLTVVKQWDQSHRWVGAHLALAFLADRLAQCGDDLESLPAPIQTWVNFAFEICEHLAVDPLDAPNAIAKNEGYPEGPPLSSMPELLVRVPPGTRHQDWERMWPQVALRQTELGEAPPRNGESEEFERDLELARLYEELQNYDDVIKAYHRVHPEENLITPGMPIPDDVREKVRKAVLRTNERTRSGQRK